MNLPSFPEWTEDMIGELARRAGKPVLVVFWADPGPSNQWLEPVLEAVAKEFAGRAAFAKVNLRKAPSLARELNLPGTPTVAVFDGSTMVEQRGGVAPLWVYREMLERALVAYTA